jgi:hypothetical protein
MAENNRGKIGIIHIKILVNNNYHYYMAGLSGGLTVHVRRALARKGNWGWLDLIAPQLYSITSLLLLLFYMLFMFSFNSPPQKGMFHP